MGGRIAFFTAFDVWTSDGTAAGTQQLATLTGGVRSVAATGGEVFFTVVSGPMALWRSDLTAAGTRSVAQVSPGPSIVARPGGGVLFDATDDAGREPWMSDGTNTGTRRLADIALPPLDRGADVFAILSLGSFALFTANDGVHGSELWRTDGTARGTSLLADLRPGTADSSPNFAGAVSGRAFFSAVGVAPSRSLWVTDGTQAGTVRLSPAGVDVDVISVLGPERVVVRAQDAAAGVEPWISDGTVAGTRMLIDLTPGPAPSNFTHAVAVDDRHFAFAGGPYGGRNSLWWSDGTALGTRRVAALQAGGIDVPVALGGRAFFLGYGADAGLWSSDGTAAGTVRVHLDARVPFAGLGAVWFFDSATSLWRTDGTVAGTQPGVSFGGGDLRVERQWDGRLIVRDDRLAPHETTLWMTDGTSTGTRLLARLPGRLHSLAPLGSERMALLIGSGASAGDHQALWSIDRGGNVRSIASLVRGDRPVFGATFAGPVNGHLLLTHDDGTWGNELWTWDPGATSVPMPSGCVAVGRRVELRSDDPRLGMPMSVAGGTTPAGAAVALWLGTAALPMPRAGACSLAAWPQTLVAAFLPGAPDWLRTLTIPNQFNLLGTQTVLQAIWGPTPSRVDISNGVLLTFGR